MFTQVNDLYESLGPGRRGRTRVPQHSRVRDARVLAGQPVAILKCGPGEAEALRANHAEITPGYHMNKKHWITIAPGDSIDKKLVRELVTESYRLVVENLPQSRRAVGSGTTDPRN